MYASFAEVWAAAKTLAQTSASYITGVAAEAANNSTQLFG